MEDPYQDLWRNRRLQASGLSEPVLTRVKCCLLVELRRAVRMTIRMLQGPGGIFKFRFYMVAKKNSHGRIKKSHGYR